MSLESAEDPTENNLDSKFEDLIRGIGQNRSGLSDWLTEKLSKGGGIPEKLAEPLALLILLVALGAFAWILFKIVRPLILSWFRALARRTNVSWDDELFGHGVFRWASHFVTALVIYVIAPQVLGGSPGLTAVVVAVAHIYMIFAGYFIVDSLLNFGQSIYQKSEHAQRIPIGTFVQVVKLITALVAVLLIIAVIAGRSPMVLLGGLGVFATVLMLVFKDTILGFVAGIQIASNEMLRPGDWLEMPSQGADGDVETIGLTVVKVRNFDKTITTVPTYALISQSFKNWRGMSESGVRRIKRSILVGKPIDSLMHSMYR